MIASDTTPNVRTIKVIKNDKKKGVDKDGIAKAIKEYKDPTKLTAAIHALINKEDETSNSDSNESNSSSD